MTVKMAGAETPRAEEHSPPTLPLTLNDWATRELAPPDFISGSWLSTTSRVLVFAPTGEGKTLKALALGIRIANGSPFLHWPGIRRTRVLYIDGEMSSRLLKARLAAETKRVGAQPDTFFALSWEDIEDFQPLNTKAGQLQIENIIRIYGIEFIIFDNIMVLISGDQKDEEGWRQILPWIKSLTKRCIGQMWLHHTGHDETRSYGTKTREWQMDTVMQMEHFERDDTDVSFTLKFPKARERAPGNRADFEDVRVALVDDEWVYQRASGGSKAKVAPMAEKFFEALQTATTEKEITRDLLGNPVQGPPATMYGKPAATIEQWQLECVSRSLIQPPVDGKFANTARALFSRNKLTLISANWITCNETHAWIQ